MNNFIPNQYEPVAIDLSSLVDYQISGDATPCLDLALFFDSIDSSSAILVDNSNSDSAINILFDGVDTDVFGNPNTGCIGAVQPQRTEYFKDKMPKYISGGGLIASKVRGETGNIGYLPPDIQAS